MKSGKKTEKPYRAPNRHQPFFSFVKKILRLFYRRPAVTSLSGALPERAIFVANHCSKKGPVVYSLYLPAFFAPWGAHEMLGNYSSRFHYLRDVYYIQKKGYHKPLASVCAAFEAAFSIFFYRGMHFLPSYPDARLAKTVRNSLTALENNVQVLVFPEDSSEGYKEQLTAFFPGFVMVAEHYFRKFGTDLPVYPVYYNDRTDRIVIGKPGYVQKYVRRGMDRTAIAEVFRKKVNALLPLTRRPLHTKA